MENNHNRAAWIEIDLDAVRDNCKIIRSRIGSNRKLIAVVKADAYGHGVLEVASTLAKAGADILAVASAAELIELRRMTLDLPVMVLGHVPPSSYAAMISQNGVFTVYSLEQAQQINGQAGDLGKQAVVHLKVDTGMGRLGFMPEQAEQVAEAILKLPHLDVQGVFSHLAMSDTEDNTYLQQQQRKFDDFVSRCAACGLHFPLRHMANSGAVCQWPEAGYDAVRAGIILYGCAPSPQTQLLPGLRPAMTVHARIVQLQWQEEGSYIGYGCTWQCPRKTLVATVPLGYADGVPRLLSNRGQVLVAGRRVPIIGRVCMDQLMVDVTELSSRVDNGDDVVVIGNQGQESISADEVAEWAETINYEILCGFRARLEREYKPEPDVRPYRPIRARL